MKKKREIVYNALIAMNHTETVAKATSECVFLPLMNGNYFYTSEYQFCTYLIAKYSLSYDVVKKVYEDACVIASIMEETVSYVKNSISL